MTRKQISIDQLSTETSRRSLTEAAILQRDIKKLRQTLSDQGRIGKQPDLRQGRKKTKTVREASLAGILGALGGSMAEGYYNDLDVRLSTAQLSKEIAKMTTNAQRIR